MQIRYASLYLLFLGACSPEVRPGLLPSPGVGTLESAFPETDLPIETRGLGALDVEISRPLMAYWSEVLQAVDMDASSWPVRPRWTIRNHARYLNGSRSSAGDSMDRKAAAKHALSAEKQREEAGFRGLRASVSARFPLGPALVEPAAPTSVRLIVIPPLRRLHEQAQKTLGDLGAILDRPSEAGHDHALSYRLAAGILEGPSDDDVQIPMPLRGEMRNGGDPLLVTTLSPYAAGSFVVQEKGASVVERAFRRDRSGIDALKTTAVALTRNVWLARVELPGAPPSIEIGIPLLDALGAPRPLRARIDSKRGTWYENALELRPALPSMDRHSTAVWPVPRPEGTEDVAAERAVYATEAERRAVVEGSMICATEAWLEQSPGLWVLEYADSSEPLAPDYLITADPSRVAESSDRLALVVVTLDLEPALLLTVLEGFGARIDGAGRERIQQAYGVRTDLSLLHPPGQTQTVVDGDGQ